MRAERIELAVRLADGNAGALDFLRGLTLEDGGWDLAVRLDKLGLRGSVLYQRTRNVMQQMAFEPAGSTDLTYSECARRVLA